jgi:hypothetical protein
MKQYFAGLTTLEEAKTEYRRLLKENHPDLIGPEGTAITAEIISQFKIFSERIIQGGIDSFFKDKKYNPEPGLASKFADVIAKAVQLDCDLEIIGFWVYAFRSYKVKEQLKELGFWWSSGHRAWVYNGRNKGQPRGEGKGWYTDAEIRLKHGSQRIYKTGIEDDEEDKKN